jgi:hypothetical protein
MSILSSSPHRENTRAESGNRSAKLPPPLNDKHRHLLEVESAIAPEIIAERGTFTARRGKDVPQEHGRLPAKPGVVFRVHTLDGDTLERLRLDNPGRLSRYRQPKGMPNRLDVHPRQQERIKRTGDMRYVTEGERKVDSGVSRGMLMIGLSGVWNGQKDGELIPDWDLLPLQGEKISICFDSDIETNPMVQLAADRQARLLRERGAEVYLTLLPTAPDGGKRGLDDFFANGGTVEELESLTQPYRFDLVVEARLSRDRRLRLFVERLWRDWHGRDWMRFAGVSERPNWARGHTARDVRGGLIDSGARSGNFDGRGLVVTVGLRTLAELSAKSVPSVRKAVRHLEAEGLLEVLPAEDESKPHSYRLLAPAQPFHSMERGDNEESFVDSRESFSVGDSQGVKGLRAPTAPRLRWSAPGRPRQREFEVVKGTKGRVRHSGKPPRDATAEDLEARPYVKRLGPHRGAVVDTLEAAGGELHLEDLCEALHRKRPRELRSRGLLTPLQKAGVIECEGDMIRLADDWIDRLEEERRRSGEVKQAERQAEKHREQSKRFREHLTRERRGTPKASLDAARRAKNLRERRLRERRDEEERDRAPTPPAVESLISRMLRQHERLRLGLLCEIALEEGLRWRDIPPAVRRLGYRIERLPEYDNAEFVFAEGGVARVAL